MPQHHPLAQNKAVSLKDLVDEQLFLDFTRMTRRKRHTGFFPLSGAGVHLRFAYAPNLETENALGAGGDGDGLDQ